MAYPTFPTLSYSYSDFQQGQGNNLFPGSQVDNDLAVLKNNLTALNQFVRGITRSDGRLANGIVTRDSLDPAFSLGAPKAIVAWESGADYEIPELVTIDSKIYSCIVNHTAGTFSADLAAENWALIADFSVPDTGDGSIVTSQLANGAVTEEKLADDAVSTLKILNDAVTEDKIVDGAISATKIAANAVGATQIAANAVVAAKIAANAVTTAKVADLAITQAKLDASVQALLGGVPAGAVLPFARSAAPTGWLKADGSAVSRTTYAALWTAIGTAFGAGDGSTTFNLPDLRGEFVRGVDDSRGIDTDRVLGSAQAGMVGPHNHTATTTGTAGSAGAHTHTVTAVGIGSPDSSGVAGGSFQTLPTTLPTSSDGAHTHPLAASTTVANNSGTENRPRNVALLYCIKT